jgi:hypothetical protein
MCSYMKFLVDLGPRKLILHIPFVNHVNYLGVIVKRLHIETTEAKAFRTFIRIYFLFRNECLSTNNKLTFHKVLIRLIMTYACPAWELAADTCRL